MKAPPEGCPVTAKMRCTLLPAIKSYYPGRVDGWSMTLVTESGELFCRVYDVSEEGVNARAKMIAGCL